MAENHDSKGHVTIALPAALVALFPGSQRELAVTASSVREAILLECDLAQTDEHIGNADAVAGPAVEREGVVQQIARLVSAPEPQFQRGKVVQDVRFAGLVPCLPGQGQGLSEVGCGPLVTALQLVILADPYQRAGFTGPVARLAADGQSLFQVPAGLPEVALLPLDDCQIAECPGLTLKVPCFLG